MQKSILITGITGYLGSNIAAALVKNDYVVIGLKRKTSSLKRLELIKDKIVLYNIEDINFHAFFKKNNKINAVIHTATSYGRNHETPYEIFESNTGFALKILDAASEAGISTFINTDTILDKYLNLYSLTKEHLLDFGKFYSMTNRIKFINMKLEHFYGNGDNETKFTTYVINKCLSNSISTLDLTLGEQLRDFVYIEDVISAYLILLEAETKSDNWFSEYDVGSGNSVTVRKFVETVHEITKSKIILNFGAVPYRKGEVMNSKPNITGLQKLGWECKFNLEKGLRITIEKENR